MARPSRIELTLAPPIGLGLLGVSIVAAAIAGASHPELRPLVVFAIAVPLLWVVLATVLSYTTARSLRTGRIEVPGRTHAMGSFVLGHTLSNSNRVLPALGVLSKPVFSIAGVVLETAPWAHVPIIEAGRTVTSTWGVIVRRRGKLRIGHVRAAVELTGSAIRATAVFDATTTITVLPAVYQLQPFVDALLAGRHVAGGRFQLLPAAVEEYVGAREYRPGDSPKLIHRVLSLRASDRDQLFVREFKDPSRDDVSVVSTRHRRSRAAMRSGNIVWRRGSASSRRCAGRWRRGGSRSASSASAERATSSPCACARSTPISIGSRICLPRSSSAVTAPRWRASSPTRCTAKVRP